MEQGSIPKLDKRTIALVFLVLTGAAWGYNWVVMKIAVEYAPPLAFAALRMLGGGVVLALGGLALRRRMRPEPPMRFYVIVGFFQNAGFVGLATWAIVTAGAGKVAILAYTMPLWAALLAWPYLGERISIKQGCAIVIAFAGVVCMVGRVDNAWFPDLLAILAGLSWAVGVVYMKAAARTRTTDLYRLSTWQMLFAGAMLAIAAGIFHGHAIVWSPAFVLALSYNIVIASAVSYSLWFFALSVLPAGDAAMGSLLAPVVGIVAAWIQLGERPPQLELAGMLLVLAGLTFLVWIRRAGPRGGVV